jgi:aspartyl-tRNA(Asn)/glutamyl-tRNA(Gln) amidotransferase subunit C
MELQKSEIEHIAKLARLDLTDFELEKYGNELSGILSYIEQLREVDTENIEATAQVTGLENVFREDVKEDWQDDEREAALKEAPEIENNQIKVKRVLN